MSNTSNGRSTSAILRLVTEVPQLYPERGKALNRIAEIGLHALGCRACLIVSIDLNSRVLVQDGFAGFDESFVKRHAGRAVRFNMDHSPITLDADCLANCRPIEIHGLDVDGGGIATPEAASRHGISSVLACPLTSEGKLAGYFAALLSSNEVSMEQVADWTALVQSPFEMVERLEEHRALTRSSGILRSLFEGVQMTSLKDVRDFAASKACDLFEAPGCVIWSLDDQRETLSIAAVAGAIKEKFQKMVLTPPDLNVPHLKNLTIGYLPDITKSGRRFQHFREASSAGWVSLLSAPLHYRGHLRGILDIYTTSLRLFRSWEKTLLQIYSGHVADAIQLTEHRTTMDLLLRALNEVAAATSRGQLEGIVVDRALQLVGANRASISRVHMRKGELTTVLKRGEGSDPAAPQELPIGIGITGAALQLEMPLRIPDVRVPEWQKIYRPIWPDTLSELAVPIMIDAQVRVSDSTAMAPKPFGVLNIESARANAFTDLHQYSLSTLARHAAVVLDRLDFTDKLDKISRTEATIATLRHREAIIDTFLESIGDIWGYEYVALSFVNDERRRIRAHAARGITGNLNAYLKQTDHPMDGPEMRADICRTRKIEVPEEGDSRLDPVLEKQFGHARFRRVFLPLVLLPDNAAIGTIVAGYDKTFRKHIYEGDVQGLRGLADYVTLALEQTKKPLLDRISHELNAPLVGIRANASFLQRRIRSLASHRVERKLDDILIDAELLAYQGRQLEYFIGRVPPASKIEATSVHTDVIVKVIQQLRTCMERDYGLQPTVFAVDNNSFRTMNLLYLDRAKMNQVVYNLLINAMKYNGKNIFRVQIGLETKVEHYIIRFVDYGIGIERSCESRIFEEGFRTPEAEKLTANGSGLGLAICKSLLRGMGGDLILKQARNPTEFQVILPKRLEEDPSASLH